ncbi:MAG TPA: aspartate kinase [Spirochaetota bacterium]|nr:aspartate kinase [Spirochaetota bacterium]
MGLKVAKFGGTSVADTNQILKVQAIVLADTDRRYIVPSAPGKRSVSDSKITDLLYLCRQHAQQEVPFEEVFSIISERYLGIVEELGLSLDLRPHLNSIKNEITKGATQDYTASRGEYLTGLILAQLLGYEFVDPSGIIFFDKNEVLDFERTKTAVSEVLSMHERAVIPGFYGCTPDGSIKTFSRGGSDITGALIANGVNAEIYENWTDVSGLLMADPTIVENPKPIDTITYRELRELAYMGAKVLHDEAIFPVKGSGIPVLIKNTNSPGDPGTVIMRDAEPVTHKGTITGIAGKKHFTVIVIEKSLMNTEIGFGRRLLTVLEAHGISFEHMPSGIDTISLVIADQQLDHKLDKVIEEIHAECRPDAVEVYPNMALIATVGRGMIHTPGIASQIFTALYNSSINVRMIDQGSSEINIIVGVETEDFERAIRAIYSSFEE